MTTWNAGSIGSVCLNMIENVSTAISGTIPVIVEKAAQKVSNHTGDSIDASGFDGKYMPAILNYSLAEITSLMGAVGADVNSIRLGDFQESTGQGSNIDTISKDFELKGDKELDALGRRVDVTKAFG